MNALEEAPKEDAGEDEEFDEVWVECEDEEMTCEDAPYCEEDGNSWSEAYEWYENGAWDEWAEAGWQGQGGVYCLVPNHWNGQLNQEKKSYLENFKNGVDNRIEDLDDVLFVLENDVKRDDYKVAKMNTLPEAQRRTVCKSALPVPAKAGSSSSSGKTASNPYPGATPKGYKLSPPAKAPPPSKNQENEISYM